MAFKGVQNLNGRPKGSRNKIQSKVKEILSDKLDELLYSIHIEGMDTTTKVQLLKAILPYVVSRDVASTGVSDENIFEVKIVD
jgi:hypothetical protein